MHRMLTTQSLTVLLCWTVVAGPRRAARRANADNHTRCLICQHLPCTTGAASAGHPGVQKVAGRRLLGTGQAVADGHLEPRKTATSSDAVDGRMLQSWAGQGTPSPYPDYTATPGQVGLETTITAVAAVTVSLAVMTSVVVSMFVGTATTTDTSTTWGSLAACLGGISTLTILAVQQWAVLGSVSINLPRHYTGVACGLQWTNFQVRLLGSQDKPACRWPVHTESPPLDPIAGSISSLLGQAPNTHHRSLLTSTWHQLGSLMSLVGWQHKSHAADHSTNAPRHSTDTAGYSAHGVPGVLEGNADTAWWHQVQQLQEPLGSINQDIYASQHTYVHQDEYASTSQSSMELGQLFTRILQAVPVDDLGRDTLVLQAYERLAVMGIILAVLLFIHQLVAWYWHFLLANKSIPKLFAFPHPELLLLTAFYLPMSEAAGILISTGRLVPSVVGAVIIVIQLAYLVCVALVCKFIYHHRVLVQDELQMVPRALSQKFATSLRHRLQSARSRIERVKSLRCMGPALDELQVRELAYRAAKQALQKEEKEEAKRSWLEPTRTDGYIQTGINLAAVVKLLRVHAPVVFGMREVAPGDRMWMAVESVRERCEASLESLARRPTEQLADDYWDGLQTEKFKAMQEHQAISAYAEHQHRRAAWAMAEACELADASAVATAQLAEDADSMAVNATVDAGHEDVLGQQHAVLAVQPTETCTSPRAWWLSAWYRSTQVAPEPVPTGQTPVSCYRQCRQANYQAGWCMERQHVISEGSLPVAEAVNDTAAANAMSKHRPKSSLKLHASPKVTGMQVQPHALEIGHRNAPAVPPAFSSGSSLLTRLFNSVRSRRSSENAVLTEPVANSTVAGTKHRSSDESLDEETGIARGAAGRSMTRKSTRFDDAASSTLNKESAGRVPDQNSDPCGDMVVDGSQPGAGLHISNGDSGDQDNNKGESGIQRSSDRDSGDQHTSNGTSSNPRSSDKDVTKAPQEERGVRRGARFHADVEEAEVVRDKQREEQQVGRGPVSRQPSNRSLHSQTSGLSTRTGFSMAFTMARTDMRTLQSQASRASSRSTLAVLRATGTDAGTARAAAVAEVERQKQLIHCELKERLGTLYKDYRVAASWPACFFHPLMLLRCLLLGVLVGIQQGAGIAVGTPAALALNLLLYLVSLGYCGLVVFTRPHNNLIVQTVMSAASCCEAGLMFCILMMWWDEGDKAAEGVCFSLQVVAVGMMVLLMWAATAAVGMELVRKIRHDRDKAQRKLALSKEEAAIWAMKFDRAQAEEHGGQGGPAAAGKAGGGKESTADDSMLQQAIQAGEREGRELRKQLETGNLPPATISIYLGSSDIQSDEGSTVVGAGINTSAAGNTIPTTIDLDEASISAAAHDSCAVKWAPIQSPVMHEDAQPVQQQAEQVAVSMPSAVQHQAALEAVPAAVTVQQQIAQVAAPVLAAAEAPEVLLLGGTQDLHSQSALDATSHTLVEHLEAVHPVPAESHTAVEAGVPEQRLPHERGEASSADQHRAQHARQHAGIISLQASGSTSQPYHKEGVDGAAPALAANAMSMYAQLLAGKQGGSSNAGAATKAGHAKPAVNAGHGRGRGRGGRK